MAFASAAGLRQTLRSSNRLLTACAWAVHAYTASGAILGLLAIEFAASSNFRAAFVAMALATAVDASDGPLARVFEVRRRIPYFDGVMLDNVIDYLTYVIAPVFLMLRAALLPPGKLGLLMASLAVMASAYGFCRFDAKTEDHYFLGFPSYWNLVAFYLFCFRLAPAVNAAIVAVFAVMVFVPVKYIYPNRTRPLRPLTLALAAVWAAATVAMLPQLPAPSPILLSVSLSFVVYYFVMSFALHWRALAAAGGARR